MRLEIHGLAAKLHGGLGTQRHRLRGGRHHAARIGLWDGVPRGDWYGNRHRGCVGDVYLLTSIGRGRGPVGRRGVRGARGFPAPRVVVWSAGKAAAACSRLQRVPDFAQLRADTRLQLLPNKRNGVHWKGQSPRPPPPPPPHRTPLGRDPDGKILFPLLLGDRGHDTN